MTDIEQLEFAVLKAALTATLEFLVVEVNREGFREEMLYHDDKWGQNASASLRSRKVFAPQTALRQHMRRRDSGYGGINYSMNPIDFVERFKSESNDLSVSVSCTRHDSEHVLHA